MKEGKVLAKRKEPSMETMAKRVPDEFTAASSD